MMDAAARRAESRIDDADLAALAGDVAGDHAVERPTLYVYEAPVRIAHWVSAFAIFTLMVTGYLIGSPLPTVSGEAYDTFVMGYIRFTHFAAGQVLAVSFLARIVWAFFGNAHSRQIFYIPVWSKQFWYEVFYEAAWYAFLVAKPKRYVGHNPLAQVGMFTGFTLFVAFMIITGFALYSEGTGIDSWQHKLFGWVFSIWPNSQDVHTWHHLGMWALVTFVIVHVYAAIREDIMSRQSMISSIVSGERQFRD
ncbi:MAG: Ni/Fe-hydrogenase, b-type cytochrome subunit [Bradyrhizobium sp.]|uniref:Ni/Fe-hydrogenase, b-type cytochrome subunit n=1 Tax=Bradyrhizobium sp. TaxID=376 RepID=UPI0025C00661|nr:Ni/Fe-hydrogenase, b-type cytochrome subunit [Bradyrhizobium sp.]MBI5260624.1 Ni/Fe-hydrogenase, b-type cytochrome subunit [Bradyrhizobium sp.]